MSNVVVLASGFASTHPEVTRAIEAANGAGILTFAAASNYGNLAEIVFPGRLYTSYKVMCMFATDPSSRSSPLFNPSASRAARYSFAVLGENVSLPRVDGLLSGTSYATMIGAAVAARILDFARHKDVRAKLRCAESLKTVEGMSAVFALMARGAVDNGYHCLSPWKLIPLEIGEEEEAAVRRTRVRQHICESISRALEYMYSG